MSFIKNKKVIVSLLAVVLVVASSWYALAKVKNKIEDQQSRISKLEASNIAKQEEEIRIAEEKKKQEDEAVLLAEQQRIQQGEQEKRNSLELCESRKKECPIKIAFNKQEVAKSEEASKDYKSYLKNKVDKCKSEIDDSDERLRLAQEQKCTLTLSVSSKSGEYESKLENSKLQLREIVAYCAGYQNPCL